MPNPTNHFLISFFQLRRGAHQHHWGNFDWWDECVGSTASLRYATQFGRGASLVEIKYSRHVAEEWWGYTVHRPTQIDYSQLSAPAWVNTADRRIWLWWLSPQAQVVQHQLWKNANIAEPDALPHPEVSSILGGPLSINSCWKCRSHLQNYLEIRNEYNEQIRM